MADILPVETTLPIVYEYEDILQQFEADLSEDETLVSLEIIKWEENEGITVKGSKYFGQYTNSFDFGTDRLLYRMGDMFSHFDSWEDIKEPNKTDVYKWKAPTKPRIYSYTVKLVYSVTESGEGGSSRSSVGGSTITKVYTQSVLPNWDMYAKKLREQIEIRRKTWQD